MFCSICGKEKNNLIKDGDYSYICSDCLSLEIKSASTVDTIDLKKAIIGKWFQENRNKKIEFLKDSTVIWGLHAGDYKFIDDNRLRMDFKTEVKVFEVSINKEGMLILKEPTGESNRYLTEKSKLARIEADTKVRFVFSDLTVLDKEKNLMWTRNANIAGKKMNRDEAFKFVDSLNEQKYAGYNNWRLPDIGELMTLILFGKSFGYYKNLDKLFNEIGFTNVQSLGYWSSNFVINRRSGLHRYVNMERGDAGQASMTYNLYVLPVWTG